jgi:Rrf2 family protein
MKVSRRTDYALRVLCGLAERQGDGPVPIRELSERHGVPRRFLEQIMLELKSYGWVRSLPGRSGGYELALPPEALSLGHVVRRFQGLLAPLGCVSASAYEPCDQEPVCKFRRVFLEVRNRTTAIMDSATLARVKAGSAVASDEVFDPAFVHGDGI